MDLEAFRKDFLEAVWAAAEARQDFQRAAFVDEAVNRLTEADEVSDFETCHYEGVGHRGRKVQIDGYAFDDTDNSLKLLIADFSGEEDVPSLGQADAKRLFGMLGAFVGDTLDGRLTDGSVDESTPGYGLASDILAWRKAITRFRFYLISDAQLSSRIKDWPEEEMGGVPLEFHIWDIARFHRAFESATGRDDLVIDFRQFGCEGLPCLKAGEVPGEYEAYLCMIPGNVLADVYNRYGSRLLEGNVRSFLSTKSKVNSGIQATIRSAPEMFFAYNNGIAATAETIVLDRRESELRIISATDLQIVNGGQTTATLAASKRQDDADLAAISVQMKLSVVASGHAMTLIPNIAKYANSQNKVSDADFFSNHPYHIRMEEISRRLWTPAAKGQVHGTHWFYERARGQYVNEQTSLSRAKKSAFQLQNPRDQVIVKTDVAKLENTWRGLPHKVSLGAQKNFLIFAEWVSKKWTEDDIEFNEEYFRRVVALAILYRHTEKLVSVQPWYQNGYRANIVTYSLAALRDMVSQQVGDREIDLTKIWDRQAVPPEIDAELVRITRRVFDVLISPDVGIQNVTEWAKKEFCWTRIKALNLELSDGLIRQLVSRERIRTIKKAAAAQQEVDSGINAQVEVMKIPKAQWAKMKKWADSKSLLTPKESQIMETAAHPARIASDKQSALILEVKKRLLDAGYRD